MGLNICFQPIFKSLMELKRGWGAALLRLSLAIYTFAPPFRPLEQHLPKIAKKASYSILISPHWAVASPEEKLGKTSRLASLDMKLKEYLIKNLPLWMLLHLKMGITEWRSPNYRMPCSISMNQIGASSLRRAPWQLLHVSSMIEKNRTLLRTMRFEATGATDSFNWLTNGKQTKQDPYKQWENSTKNGFLDGQDKGRALTELPCEIIISSLSQAPRAH